MARTTEHIKTPKHKSIKKMEMTAHFSPSSTSTVRTFDSTDKILDEIDAKLNGVSKFSSSRQFDVNEDPGFDVSSVQKFRNHMSCYPEEAPLPQISLIVSGESSKEPKSEAKVFHEKRTNLLQGYDDDINLLRKMLQGKENTDTSQKEPKKTEINLYKTESPNQSNGYTTIGDFTQTSEELPKKDLNTSTQPRVTFQLPVPIPDQEPTPCTCGCETALEKMTKERDELRARIRRGEASRTSIEERQELERQLHSTRSDLFQQRKKSRQQLEDIEEKLDEAQHYYDQKLADKDEIIAMLQKKVETLPQTDESSKEKEQAAPPPPPPPDNSWLKREIAERDAEISRLSELVGKQQQALEDAKSKLENEIKKSKSIVNEELSSHRSISDEKLKTLKAKFDKEISEHKNEVVQIQNENKHLRQDNLELTQNLEDYRKQVEVKESKFNRDNIQKENDYKATTELLKHKIESLKEELSRAFASKSKLELDFRRKENLSVQESKSKENELVNEKKKLEDQVQRLQIEVTQAVAKLKEFKIEIEHQDHALSSSVCDECNKLSNVINSIQSSTNISRKPYHSNGNVSCKRAVCELQDLIISLNRATNDLLCEFTRLKREVRKKSEFKSHHGNNDVSIASEEAKMLREKLNEKEFELKELQVNMNQWKDLTAQRLAEKFQEELQLQVERKLSQHRSEHSHKHKDIKTKPDMGRFSKSANNLATNTPSQHSDTSTVKLLSHLQGRVKQLRSENDLLRSSNYIKGLDGR